MESYIALYPDDKKRQERVFLLNNEIEKMTLYCAGTKAPTYGNISVFALTFYYGFVTIYISGRDGVVNQTLRWLIGIMYEKGVLLLNVIKRNGDVTEFTLTQNL